MRPLTILHTIRAPRGGVLRHVDDLARAQTLAGHKVGLVCDGETGNPRDSGILDALARDLALGIDRIAMRRTIGVADIAAAMAVAGAINQAKPDVVHGHGAKGGAFGRLGATGARRNGLSMVRFYTPHGGSLHYDPRSATGRVAFFAERALEKASEGIVFVSQFEQATYIEKVGAPRCPTRLVYNGLRDAEFTPVDPAPDAADILFLGEMRLLKGVDVLIDALASLNAEQTVTAALVGAGPDREAFGAQIRRLGLEDRVRLIDPRPARDAFSLGRILVVPSLAESLPYVVLEAAAAGRPIIASNVGGIPEIQLITWCRLETATRLHRRFALPSTTSSRWNARLGSCPARSGRDSQSMSCPAPSRNSTRTRWPCSWTVRCNRGRGTMFACGGIKSSESILD
jgi:glycosyltransferase involved in cell wall biosynthesis